MAGRAARTPPGSWPCRPRRRCSPTRPLHAVERQEDRLGAPEAAAGQDRDLRARRRRGATSTGPGRESREVGIAAAEQLRELHRSCDLADWTFCDVAGYAGSRSVHRIQAANDNRRHGKTTKCVPATGSGLESAVYSTCVDVWNQTLSGISRPGAAMKTVRARRRDHHAARRGSRRASLDGQGRRRPAPRPSQARPVPRLARHRPRRAPASHAPVAAHHAVRPACRRRAQTELVTTYCATCHSERGKAGGLSLANFDAMRAQEHPEVAEKMIRKLRAGMMPPAGAKRPDAATLDALAARSRRGSTNWRRSIRIRAGGRSSG